MLPANSLELKIKDQNFVLDSSKALFWIEHSSLIVSDLHIGKAAHFRKNGIPISQKVTENDIAKLKSLIEKYSPTKLILLGDVYHSDSNKEWKLLDDLLCKISAEIIFVIGNHDKYFEPQDIKFKAQFCDIFNCNDFTFSHKNIDIESQFVICGHIHPAYFFRTKGRQSLRLPCFWLQTNNLILPAFSDFTGSYNIKPQKNDRIFALSGNTVSEIPLKY